MKIELEKEDVEFINNLLTTVKVNDKAVHLQSLTTVLNKLNQPVVEENATPKGPSRPAVPKQE